MKYKFYFIIFSLSSFLIFFLIGDKSYKVRKSIFNSLNFLEQIRSVLSTLNVRFIPVTLSFLGKTSFCRSSIMPFRQFGPLIVLSSRSSIILEFTILEYLSCESHRPRFVDSNWSYFVSLEAEHRKRDVVEKSLLEFVTHLRC